METELICINSDAVCRDNTIFPISTLEKSLRDIYDRGMTMLIGHDIHRPIGWIIPFGLYIEPKLSRMFAKRLLADTTDDSAQILEAHQNHVQKRYHEAFKKVETPFLELIGAYLTDNHMRLEAGCPAIYESKIVEKCLPGIFDNVDKDGLIHLSDLFQSYTYLGQGVFKHKTSSLAVFAHRYFRRTQSIHNNFHFVFLDELIKQNENKGVSVKIRIDEDMIGYAPGFHFSMEHEYHYGPKYTDDIANMKFGISRHETTSPQRNYYGINRSEFLWKHDDNEVTFETEELTDTPSAFDSAKEEIYNCRYVHSIYNTQIGEFVHFDGAIRSYNLEEMSDRLDKNFLEYGRKAIYTKLFRIDGKLALAEWKSLVTYYLQGNPLVYEYFGVDQEFNLLKAEASQQEKIHTERQLVPHSINSGDGVRIMVSYHILPENLANGRYIDVYDVMTSENGNIYCFEHLLYEIQKSISQEGETLLINEDAWKIKCDDRYWNIPSIMHNTDNPGSSVEVTKRAMLRLFEAMNKKGIDVDISLTLALPVNGRLVRISSYGNIIDQINWLKEQSQIASNDEGIATWINEQREYLSKYPVQLDKPFSWAMIQHDGVLFLKRKPVPYEISYVESDKGLGYSFKIPTDREDLSALVDAGTIVSTGCIRVLEAQWSDSGEDYYTSNRSKWLDEHESSVVQISKWEPLAIYWSKSGNKNRRDS